MLEAINHHAAVFSAIHSLGPADSQVTPAREPEQAENKTEKSITRQVRTEPGQKTTGPNGKPRDSFELSREAEEIRKLQVRDREVRAHEAAHAAAGGAYAGSPTYTFERGPDGGRYAVGGEVSIDVSSIAGDPEATLQKAQQIRAAALAPTEPSAQDMQVAQRAQAMAAKARIELSEQRSEGFMAVGRSPESEGAEQQQDASADRAARQPDINSSRVSRLDIRA